MQGHFKFNAIRFADAIYPIRNNLWLPEAKNWEREFGLPKCIGELPEHRGNLDVSDYLPIMEAIHRNVPDGANVMPAIHKYWHWRLVSKYEGSALSSLVGAGRNPGLKPGLRAVIRDVAKYHLNSAKGALFPAKDLDDMYFFHWFVYGGGYCAPSPHPAAYILQNAIHMSFDYRNFCKGSIYASKLIEFLSKAK